MKKIYEKPELNLTVFECENIIQASTTPEGFADTFSLTDTGDNGVIDL